MRGARVTAAVLAVCLLSSTAAWAEDVSDGALPEPYTAEEFPDWAVSLRRFEVISLGAFPFMRFYARAGADLGRYVANGFDSDYAPWPFKTEYSYEMTDGEQVECVLAAAGLSLAFGALDAVLLYISTRKAP